MSKKLSNNPAAVRARKNRLIARYEQESGNIVKDGQVYDDSGNRIARFTLTLAKDYHSIAEGTF